jgi:hypothetical protein
MSPLTEQALMMLTMRINLSTGLDHYSDDSAAKEILKRLRDEGEILRGSEIAAWAASKHWKPDHAVKLGALADRIASGGRVVIRDKNRWPKDIIEQLRERIAPAKLRRGAKRIWQNALPAERVRPRAGRP